jgi:hypothetical protein
MTENAPLDQLTRHASRLVGEAGVAAAAAVNEATLRQELERALDAHCRGLGRPLDPYRLELFVREGSRRRFVDVAHGGVLIEYEPPRSFSGREGAGLRHARAQIEEYADLLHREEGRPLDEYTLVAWDGAHVSFGRYTDGVPVWDGLTPFDLSASLRLLQALVEDGLPLVSPRVLSALVGPESEVGARIIPHLFGAIRSAVRTGQERTTHTFLLFTEWRRLFGQVVGAQSEQLRRLLEAQSREHGQPYASHVPEYLFALNTYIALVAKLVAALALPDAAEDLSDSRVPLSERIRVLESGRLFADAGVTNVLLGDFFSWYADDSQWPELAPQLEILVARLGTISFDVSRKTPESTRDLFKGLYQSFVPRALRHALGEYYTPDWLAAHVLDRLEWQPEEALLDPTCGSGTFLLEALRRRLCSHEFEEDRTARRLLKGLYGLDLNPLAVLTARASLVVFLSPYLDPANPVRLPIFLADALNPTVLGGDVYRHTVQTELGAIEFSIPRRLVRNEDFLVVFNRLRDLIGAGDGPREILDALTAEFGLGALTDAEHQALAGTVASLVSLHERGWDGIWCAILADRFATGEIPRVEKICGNPPWVKWSHLPPEYAAFIKERCRALGVFSDDRWVGGIESDISTVITYEAVARWLAPNGRLAFLITGTVFLNESSQGFRRFRLKGSDIHFAPLEVEDFGSLNPFDGVSNAPALLLLQRDHEPEYPVPYLRWENPVRGRNAVRHFGSASEFRATCVRRDLLAAPVPGTDAGPWIRGSSADHAVWQRIFTSRRPEYAARKGVTTDRNGIFFVRVRALSGDLCSIENDPALGRKPGIACVRATVECEHLFPLLRGRGVGAFRATPDPEYRLLLPQRGMHGSEALPREAPRTHAFLARFRGELEGRSSYRRFQKKQPYWSLWSTGPYTFSRYKVVWREMSGRRFAAAYVGAHDDPVLGTKIVIPDHKLYFVPLGSEAEAGYLTGLLNAPVVARAISAYAAELSLGASVVEYLDIPPFDPRDARHEALSAAAVRITAAGGGPEDGDQRLLDEIARDALELG